MHSLERADTLLVATMINDRLAALYPFPVKVVVATLEMQHADLFAIEQMAVAKAVASRRREFTAGRASARKALEALGAPLGALPVGPDRAPVWPPGFRGSISHCTGFCAAVVCRARDSIGLGFDVEISEALPVEAESLVFSEAEILHFKAIKFPCPTVECGKIGFSAKESFYKCYNQITGEFLDFRDVIVNIESDEIDLSGRFSVELLNREKPVLHVENTQGRWAIFDGFIFTSFSAFGAKHHSLA